MADGQGVVAQGDGGGVTLERWKQIEAVFQQALELPAGERPAFFDKTCNGDEELRREVESLLDAHAGAGNFLDRQSLFFSAEELHDNGPAVAPGQMIGPYRVVREIGRGGMGAVYLAERADEQYQKQVAIKLIKRGMDTDAVLRHFRNERQILAGFDHPNIARLFDGGTTADGLPYFVMEYVEGLPLDEYCNAHALDVAERLKLFREVCAAVSYAHRHLVVHRDIKRSNILVTSEGVPKLLDFGIAKILQRGDGAEPLATMTGLRPMTPEYASPEQMRGEPVTTASDVYSLGVVLYELLTGTSPYRFTRYTPRDIERAITEQLPAKPSTAIARNQKSLRGDLDNIVLMALRKEPARRYQSVEQFSEDIRRHLQARPVLARQDTLGYRAAKFVRRNRAATLAATLVFLALLAGIIATTWQARRAREQEAAAKAQKAQAERRFNEVRKLANSVLFDYHDAIKDLPGATPVRERLVRDALTYLDSLASESAGDPALQRELAAAYERVGDVRGQAYSASLGDRAGAMESYLKALRIREALVAAVPGDVKNRRDLAVSYQKIGNQLLETSEANRGLDYLRKSLAIYSDLTAEQPTNPESRRELADVYNDVGSALEDWMDLSGALENHRKALSIREQLVAADPRTHKHRRDLSMTYVNIGRAMLLSGDAKGALESNSKGLALRSALLAEDPMNADYRRLLAIGYQNDGDYRARLGDTAGGLESFRKKLTLDEQSLRADPANASTRGDLGYSWERIGDLLADSGDYTQALSYHHRALEMWEKILADVPKDVYVRARLIRAQANIGQLHAKLGERSAALEQCATARSLLSEKADHPANAALLVLNGEAYIYLGEAYSALASFPKIAPDEGREHWRTAREMYQQSLDIWNDLRARGILAGDDAARPDEVTGSIAKCDAQLKK
jgi:tetratricopeptide (TPR) repeat protein/predicted Ser/Thr protein kinase